MNEVRRGPFVPGRPRRPRRSRKTGKRRKSLPFALKLGAIMITALIVTFVIGYLVTVRILFPPLPEPENGLVVPPLVGLTVGDAQDRLRQLRLRLTDVAGIAHPNLPAGTIVAQSPLAGQQLREMGAVRVAVSAGPPLVPVPNVIGFPVDRATEVMAALGFTADQRAEESYEPVGTIIRIIPGAGSERQVPSRIVLIVSAGPPAVAAPDTVVADSISETDE